MPMQTHTATSRSKEARTHSLQSVSLCDPAQGCRVLVLASKLDELQKLPVGSTWINSQRFAYLSYLSNGIHGLNDHNCASQWHAQLLGVWGHANKNICALARQTDYSLRMRFLVKLWYGMLQKLEVPWEWLWFWHADVRDKVEHRNYVQKEGNSPNLNIFRTREGAILGKSMTGCYFSILLWSGLFSHQNSGLLCKIVSWGIFLYAKPSLHCNSTERNEQSSFPMQFWAARRTEFKAQRERIDR